MAARSRQGQIRPPLARPEPARPAALGNAALGDAALGDAASATALARLEAGLAEMRQRATLPALRHALAALEAGQPQAGAEAALKALNIDERCGTAWHILAICREKVGDFPSSLAAYEAALQLTPDDSELANNVGQLAYRMGMKPVAEQLFRHFLARTPDSAEGANNLACALRDQMRFGEAVEALRPAIVAEPENAMLWNTLATVLTEQGQIPEGLLFLDEAVRLDPSFARAYYNRANARLATGDLDGAMADCEAAIAGGIGVADLAMMRLARAFVLLAGGDLARGWKAYAARRDPHYSEVLHFAVDAPAWTPESELSGRTLLLMGEQGLGDEVLFANLLPDVEAALGAAGRLVLAVQPRLVELFRRSFPRAEVGAYVTRKLDLCGVRTAPFVDASTGVDLWAPLADLLVKFRPAVDSFPDRARFLTPDPARVTHWRGLLDGLGGPTVGVTWKSLKVESARARYYAPFAAWEALLRTPGVRFVNLQCGETDAELEQARSLGVHLWTPPGIDLKDDLDDVTALCCALDLVIGPANATTNLAGACGAALWLISTPAAWPRLGQANYPWYPQARVFAPAAYNAWAPVMAELAEALAVRFPVERAGT